jgi:hypothetical protein
MTEEEHAEDIEDLTAEIERRDQALRIAGMNIISLTDERTKLTNALNTACILIDHLVADMAAAGLKPTVALIAAKSSFDLAMKTLLGEQIFSKIGKPVPGPEKKPN